MLQNEHIIAKIRFDVAANELYEMENLTKFNLAILMNLY